MRRLSAVLVLPLLLAGCCRDESEGPPEAADAGEGTDAAGAAADTPVPGVTRISLPKLDGLGLTKVGPTDPGKGERWCLKISLEIPEQGDAVVTHSEMVSQWRGITLPKLPEPEPGLHAAPRTPPTMWVGISEDGKIELDTAPCRDIAHFATMIDRSRDPRCMIYPHPMTQWAKVLPVAAVLCEYEVEIAFTGSLQAREQQEPFVTRAAGLRSVLHEHVMYARAAPSAPAQACLQIRADGAVPYLSVYIVFHSGFMAGVPNVSLLGLLHGREVEIGRLRISPQKAKEISATEEGAVAHSGVGSWLGVGGIGGMYAYRTAGGRRRAVHKGGGGEATEEAVEGALAWLAKYQEKDGCWDASRFGGKDADAAVTALAALTFLGAGHTYRSGKYRDNLGRAIEWISDQQGEGGCIGNNSKDGGLGFHHSVCGIALAEDHAVSVAKRRRVGEAAQKAVDYSINVHQVPYDGWALEPKGNPETVLTAWLTLQLKTARIARLKVPGEGFQGAINFFDRVTDTQQDLGLAGHRRGLPPDKYSTAAALHSRLFMGWKPNDPLCKGAADYLIKHLPKWGENNAEVDFVYWFFGTHAMFQMAGEYWKQWNEAMKKALLEHQNEDGSWEPAGTWSDVGGRVFSTAMGALCLEVYYRYLPMYR